MMSFYPSPSAAVAETQPVSRSYQHVKQSIGGGRRNMESRNPVALNRCMVLDDPPSNESVTSIEENKAVMKLTKFQQTQMMPQTLTKPYHYRQQLPPTNSSKQAFAYNQTGLMSEQDRIMPAGGRNRPSNLHQSMASCDLQASFQRNDTRNPQETTGRTKTLMLYEQQQHQHLGMAPTEADYDNVVAPPGTISQNRDNDNMQLKQQQQQLFESAEYQAISKTRLWKEIFYLRELLESKTEMLGKMEGTINDFQSKLEAEKLRNLAFERQIIELRSAAASDPGLPQQQQMQEESKQMIPRANQSFLVESQPPILQNELMSKSHHQVPYSQQMQSKRNSDARSFESANLQPKVNWYAVTEEQDIGFEKRTPHHGIQRATQDNFRRYVEEQQPQAVILQSEQRQATSPQPVNCFNPPTKASQLRIQKPNSSQTIQVVQNNNTASIASVYQQEEGGNEDEARESGHAMPPQGLNMVHATTRAQSAAMINNNKKAPTSLFDSSSASFLNRVDEEIEVNQFTSNDDSSLLINKVNEMQTKTASFGYQPQQSAQQPDANRRFQLYRQQNNLNNLTQIPSHRSGNAEMEQFLEYEIDEQVASGVRVMNGPRSGPPRSSIASIGGQGQHQQVLTAQSHVQLTNLSQHNQIEVPPTLQTQAIQQHTQPSIYQNTQLQQQRPCDQPPPRNIQGDVQSHVDAEEISNLEGVGSGLVPQQRIPLPNQQQQAMPRQPSHDDSLLDPPDSHPSLSRQQLGYYQFRNIHQMVQPLGFSADDAGMDEFDVADERLHLFGEQVNPDIMTYEQLLALQERIGFVPKGMTVQEMDKYPTMKRSEVRRYLRTGTQQPQNQRRQRAQQVSRQIQQQQHQLRQDPVRPSHGQFYQMAEEEEKQPAAAPPKQLPSIAQVELSQQQTTNEQVSQMMLAAQEDEEEKKSQQESNQDKSLQMLQDSSDLGYFSEVMVPGSNRIQPRSMHSSVGAEIMQSYSQQLQLENYQSMQNSRTSTTLINGAHSGNQINQVRQRTNFKVPMIELQSDQGGEENHELSSVRTRQPSTSQLLVNINQFSSPPGEEGKEDLEEAAPEEHHPKEEHLQQIGVSVPMPGHHIATHGGGSTSARQINQQQTQAAVQHSNQQQRAVRRTPANSNSMVSQTMQPQHMSNQVIVSEEEENNYSQEASQEDVFDEGEDVLNRRLPIVVNINGSIPNQRPSQQSNNQMAQQQVDFERQHPLYAGALAIQSNLARHTQAQTKVDANMMLDEELGNTSSNIYEEHNENEFGVQTPKCAQTKTSQKQQQRVDQHLEDEMRQNKNDQPTVVKHHHGQSVRKASHSGNLALTQQRQSVQSSTPSLAESSAASTQLGSEVCIVCQEIFAAEDAVKVLTPCKHYFHVDCVNQWLLVEKKCPMCMIPLD